MALKPTLSSGPSQRVPLRTLKRLALAELPEGALRDDILSQPDDVSPDDYLLDCTVWLRLLKLAGRPQHGAPVS